MCAPSFVAGGRCGWSSERHVSVYSGGCENPNPAPTLMYFGRSADNHNRCAQQLQLRADTKSGLSDNEGKL